jgi:hypothetical protein
VLPRGTFLTLLITYAAVVAVVVTLPAAVTVLVAALGRGLARVGRVTRSGSALMSGRWLANHPGAIARTVAGLVILMVVIMQVQGWLTRFDGPVAQAATVHRQLAGTVAGIRPPEVVTPASIRQFLRALPTDTAPIAIVGDTAGKHYAIVGGCPALASLRLPCGRSAHPISGATANARLDAVHSYYAPTGALTSHTGDAVAALHGDNASLLLVSVHGAPLPMGAIRHTGYRLVPGGVGADLVGDEWLQPALNDRAQADWLTLFSAIGTVVLTLVLLLAALAEFLRWSRVIAPISVLTGNHRALDATGGWCVFLPILLASMCGGFVAYLLALPIDAEGYGIPATPLRYCGVAAAALGALTWLWTAVAGRRQCAAWRPGGD